jgi:hypothetical protein
MKELWVGFHRFVPFSSEWNQFQGRFRRAHSIPFAGLREVLSIAIVLLELFSGDCFGASTTVSTATTSAVTLSSTGDSATVTSTGSITYGGPSAGAFSGGINSTPSSEIVFGGITIDGTVTTSGAAAPVINLTKTSTPLAVIDNGIVINGTTTSQDHRGIYINDFRVDGIQIGSAGSLTASSLAIHVVDGSYIDGDVINRGVVSSSGGTIFLGDTAVNPRVTGTVQNYGTIFGSTYAVVAQGTVTGGVKNESTGKIVG